VLQWKQLDADLASGDSPSTRSSYYASHTMVAVGSSLFVFGGFLDNYGIISPDFIQFNVKLLTNDIRSNPR